MRRRWGWVLGPYLLIMVVAGAVFEHEQSETQEVDRKLRRAAQFFCLRSNEVRTQVGVPLLECESLARMLEKGNE